MATSASLALGNLIGIGTQLPNPNLLVRTYMRREAIASSRIENTHTSFAELVVFETAEHPVTDDTREVSNYMLALDYGLRHVRKDGITAELVREIHRKLMEGTREERRATPGEFRNIQNHIGSDARHPADARYVPPPAGPAMDALDQLLAFAAAPPSRLPSLVDAAILHYQFEAIHPFLDGNGRVGRVLIPLFLAWRNQLEHPLLYLSPYFERDRSRYYDLLFAVSTRSAWIDWISYFLRGVADQAEVCAAIATDVLALKNDWHFRLDQARATQNAHRLADYAMDAIAVTPQSAQLALGVAGQTAYTAVRALEAAGILREVTGRGRSRLYLATELIDIVSRGL